MRTLYQVATSLLVLLPAYALAQCDLVADILSPDDATCLGNYQEITFWVDGTPPFNVRLRDNRGNIIFSQFYASAPGHPITVAYDPAALNLPDGHYYLTLRVWRGICVVEDYLFLIVDRTKPRPEVLTPRTGDFVSGPVTITGRVQDAHFDHGNWVVLVDNKAVGSGFGEDVEAEWVAFGLPGGSSHKIEILATDDCGNLSRSDPTQVTIGVPIHGKVDLGGYYGIPEVIDLRVEVKDQGRVIDTLRTRLDDAGYYSVVTYNVGDFDIVAKPTHWLAYKRTEVSLVGTVEMNWYFPVNGDATGDNHIDIWDIQKLLLEWTTDFVESDLDGTGKVDLFDMNTVLLNFSLVGDE